MKALTVAAYTLAFLWAFWAMYVIVMGIYRAHLAKRLTAVTLCLSAPFIVLGYLMDVVANLTVASLVFLELPRELLVTSRLQRYVAQERGLLRPGGRADRRLEAQSAGLCVCCKDP